MMCSVRIIACRPILALRPVWWLAIVFCLLSACAGRKPVHPEVTAAAQSNDVLALSDALEALINARTDTPADREYAYKIVHTHEEDTAPAMFARAAVTGRFVQQRGLLGANLIGDIERCARRSRELDPSFRDGAATRLLGTMYVIAPSTLLTHGDSEVGVELLEGLVVTFPDTLENHLRLAEAYIALGDMVPAYPHLCLCLAHKSALVPDDQILLSRLVANAGTPPCADSGSGTP
ncbi:MAG: hypothetical protein HYR72_17300 [Deltaproteobacteria bacterium]|nr:hypothetical protein [Deltaproteobacteria bacterium]MBI3386523.1 hypothetical protein [Deltaproteobacteria bacterium]